MKYPEGSISGKMNGRMYDPVVSRFISPDPFIQAPFQSENFNRYSYCVNNPLAYVDPSGYSCTPYQTFGDPPLNMGSSKPYGEDNLNEFNSWFDDYDELKSDSHGAPFTFTYHFNNKDGSTFTVEVSTSGVYLNGEATTIDDLRKYFNDKGIEINNENISSGGNSDALSLVMAGLGLLTEWSKAGGEFFQVSNEAIRAAAIENGIPTEAIDDIMLNTEIFKSASKWVGRAFITGGVVISVIDGVNAFNEGNMDGVTLSGMDIAAGLGTAAVGGVLGVVLYGGYILVFHAEHHTPPGYILDPMSPWNTMSHQDNTYVVPKY